jgi:exoribonuclease R
MAEKKKIKLKEEAISEILVADTDSESGAEASNVEDEFEEEEGRRQRRRRPHKQQQQKQQDCAEDEPQVATSGRGLSTWGTPQGSNKNFHPFVGPPKGVNKKKALHINKDSLPLSVLMSSTEIFHLLVEQTNLYYQQYLHKLDLATDFLT